MSKGHTFTVSEEFLNIIVESVTMDFQDKKKEIENLRDRIDFLQQRNTELVEKNRELENVIKTGVRTKDA